MEQGTTAKPCECGCGQPAPIATENDPKRGYVKGQPKRFIRWHSSERTVSVEVGQRFGRLVVMDANLRIPRKSSPQKTLRGARLLCDCGKEYTCFALDLHYGKITSCGCGRYLKFTDHTGQRFGRLVALRRVESGRSKKGHLAGARWLCRCDCGNEKVISGNSLTSGGVISCGCARRRPKRGYLPGVAARNKVLANYQAGASGRDLAWELTDDEFNGLITRDCHYCGSAPSAVARAGTYEGNEFLWNGIDRIDNDLGYITGNVVPCCKLCNFAKKDMPYGEFMAWIARLTEYHWFHPEQTPSSLLREVAAGRKGA